MKKLIDLRKKNDLKQETIARVLKISPAQYSRIESGKNELSLDKAIILADYYKISLDELLGRDNYVLITKDEYIVLKKAAQIILRIEKKIDEKSDFRLS